MAANLVVLVTVVALPLVILGAGALWMQYQDQRANAETQLIEQARSTALLIDREFERTLAVAETLAAAVPAAGGDLKAFEGEMRAARALLERDLPAGAPPPAVSLMDARGGWLLHTNWGPGERRVGLHGTSFGIAAVNEGRTKISDLFIAPSSGVPVVGVAVPVFASPPGVDGTRATIGGIGISLPRERLLAIVAKAGLPEGSSASVLDRKGVIVARSLRDAETVGKLPTPAVLQAVQAADHGVAPRGTKTLEGVRSVVAFAHAPFSGFTLKLDVPDKTFLAPLRDAMLHAAWVAIIVLLAGLAMAISASHRIVRSFRLALGTASGADTVLPLRRSSGLKEADEFAERLATTFAERERAAGSARALIDNSPIGIMIIAGDDQIEQVNDAFLSIVGRDRAGMADARLGWQDIAPDELVGADTETFLAWVRSGRSMPYEKEYRRPDGSTVPLLISFGMTDPTRGQAAAFLLDLTQQYAAERARHLTEDRLRFALRAGRLVAWEFDPASGVIHCPTVTNAVLGRSGDEGLSYEQFLAAIHSDDRDRVRCRIADTIRSGGDYHVEYRIIRQNDQSVHWIESRGHAVSEAGKANRLAGISVDVTDRKMSEQALRESEATLRAITDSMPQIVWSTGPDGLNDYFNRRWYDLTGASPEQTRGEGWNGAFHPDDQARAWASWRHSLATGEPFHIEYRLRMADGSYRWMLGRAEPVRDDATGAIMRWFGTCTDIEDEIAAREASARSRAALEFLVEERTRDLQATQARLAQAQRMEALGQLAGGIAHDFNNVLQAVQGASALLERRPADTGGVRRLSRMILDAADRGGAITRRLLAFSRRGDLRAEPVDAATLQTGIRDILSHTLGDGVKVAIEAPSDLPPLMADKGQLETVLINLATNGRDAMSGIGTLTLSVSAETARLDEAVDHRARLKAGRYVRLSVSDTGMGMDADTLMRASEPFFTTKPSGQGTGLGLSMARGFAEQSGGGLHIASLPGRGTTVTLWFPVAKDGLNDSEQATESPALIAARRRNARLLLVDDDPIVREVTAELMEACGFAVVLADSAAAALALFDDNIDIDIIVSDLSMPDMDGVALIAEAHRRRPGLPAILLTGYATNAAELAVGGATSGSFSLLRKPVQGDHLAERVALLLADSPARR